MTVWLARTTPAGKGPQVPASGAGGFLPAAHDYIVAENPSMDRDQRERLQRDALHGWEIVDSAARLCAMNLYLHGIGGNERNGK